MKTELLKITKWIELDQTDMANRLFKLQSSLFGPMEIEFAQPLFERLARSGGTVVDCGCANGHFLAMCARSYPNLCFRGIDNNSSMLAVAKKLIKHLQLANADIIHGDLEGECVQKFFHDADIVMFRYTLQHLKDRKNILQRIYQTIRKGGQIIAIEAVYPLYRETPESGLFTQYVQKLRQVYERVGSEYQMSMLLPLLFKNVGFEKIESRIALHGNATLSKSDFCSIVMATAVLKHRIAPDIVTKPFLEDLGNYLKDEYEKTPISLATSVTVGMKE